jgi:hypothetical protein
VAMRMEIEIFTSFINDVTRHDYGLNNPVTGGAKFLLNALMTGRVPSVRRLLRNRKSSALAAVLDAEQAKLQPLFGSRPLLEISVPVNTFNQMAEKTHLKTSAAWRAQSFWGIIRQPVRLLWWVTKGNPVYYSVRVHSGHRDPKKRLSFEFLIHLSRSAPKDAHQGLATEAAQSVLRGSLSAHTQWVIHASPFERPEIPRETPKVAANGCLVWILKSP